MSYFDRFFYDKISVPLMHGSLRIAAFFNPKIKRGFREREDLWEKLEESTRSLTEENKPRFWIHSSSAGEFLQSVPVLEEIKVNWPDAVVLFTYFSPSANTLVRSSPLVDIPSYLPVDTRENAEKIFSLFEPDILLFSRYDVWPSLVWEAVRRRCPTMLINATLSGKSSRMRPLVKGFSGRLYRDLELICAASEEDRQNFLSIGVPAWKVEVTGDTKYDETYRRVQEISREPTPLEPYLSGKRVIIGGSTWPPDEKHLLTGYTRVKAMFDDVLLMIVPHEPTPGRVQELLKKSSDMGHHPETYSDLRDRGWQGSGDILIIDQVGFLARLYGLADITLVGGGFTRSVHNVLEPAAFGKPVLFGPNHQKSPEAIRLVREGGAQSIPDDQAMEETLIRLLQDPSEQKTMGELASQSIDKNRNATGRTLAVLRSTFPKLFPQE
jgi:3-deoxy-D-manno-octulosonic-acid transferase